MPSRVVAICDPCSIDERNGPDQHAVGVFDVEWHTDKERIVLAHELVDIHELFVAGDAGLVLRNGVSVRRGGQLEAWIDESLSSRVLLGANPSTWFQLVAEWLTRSRAPS